MIDSAQVYLDLAGKSIPVGTAYFTLRRSMLTTTFRYESDYLARGSFPIDPGLPLQAGNLVARATMPGAFADAAPDRWGRNLILKRFKAEEAERGQRGSEPTEVDFLLGVSDGTRQGALRFKADAAGEFVRSTPGVPKLIELPALLHAATQVVDQGDDLAAVKLLLDAGTGSLGGARPKASVADGDRLLIAKFPHPDDTWDVMAWEKTALDLAGRAGVVVPTTRLVKVDRKHTLLLDRFDRIGLAVRVPYLSAMTLTESTDGEARDYLDIVDAISDHGANVKSDLEQLWLRAAFSSAIHSTDDHLRNHGFLYSRGGWVLSPAFDINPNPALNEQRVTSIGGATARDNELPRLLQIADAFGLKPARAREFLDAVLGAVDGWREVAGANGVRAAETDVFEPLFADGIARLRSTAAGR
jgi:serine/threonine-protein kinase HipA